MVIGVNVVAFLNPAGVKMGYKYRISHKKSQKAACYDIFYKYTCSDTGDLMTMEKNKQKYSVNIINMHESPILRAVLFYRYYMGLSSKAKYVVLF